MVTLHIDASVTAWSIWICWKHLDAWWIPCMDMVTLHLDVCLATAGACLILATRDCDAWHRTGRSDGLHGFIPSYQAIVEDHIYFVEKILRPAANAANVSLFAYGVSMGGWVVCVRASVCIHMYLGKLDFADLKNIILLTIRFACQCMTRTDQRVLQSRSISPPLEFCVAVERASAPLWRDCSACPAVRPKIVADNFTCVDEIAIINQAPQLLLPL